MFFAGPTMSVWHRRPRRCFCDWLFRWYLPHWCLFLLLSIECPAKISDSAVGYHLHMTRVVFIDVDDTLVRSAGTKRIPIPAVIARVRQLKQEGVILYLWSSGGAEYCKASAVEFGIGDCFVSFLPKPNVYIDDQPVHEWKSCKHLYPSQAERA